MKYRVFTVPAHDDGQACAALDRFCADKRIIGVEKQLVLDGQASFWAFCVTYLDGNRVAPTGRKNKIDYREVLSERDFAVYAELRTLRKQLAEEKGVPAYALFNNEQLAEMVQSRARTTAALSRIRGIGEQRLADYAEPFLAILKKTLPNDEGGAT